MHGKYKDDFGDFKALPTCFFGTELKNAVKGMKFLRSDLYGSDLGMISVTTV